MKLECPVVYCLVWSRGTIDTVILIFLGLDEVKLTEDQYSLQHIKAFGLNNHLITDPWNPHIVFFLDANWQLQKLTVHLVT